MQSFVCFRMFEGLFGRKFTSKCKSLIKITKTRLETIKKKKTAVQRYLKNDIADLLKSDLDYNAYGRVEGLLVEMNMASCYNSIEQFCDFISNHLAAIHKESECPEECREAVASLMFAAARFADLPELRDLRDMFSGKYANSLDSFINQEFVEKLKQKHPTKEMKLRLMEDIAQELSIKWDSKALVQKLHAPPASKQNFGSMGNERHRTAPEEVNDDGYKKPSSRENAVPKRENRTSSHDRPTHIKEGGQQKPSDSGRHVSEEDVDKRKPSHNRVVPPPYVKQSACEGEGAGPTNLKDHGSREDIDNQDDPFDESKRKPRSVRRKSLKPPPGHDNTGITSPVGARREHASRGLQFLRKDDEGDRMADGHSKHGSKQSTYELGKAKHILKPPPSWQAADDATSTSNRERRKSDSLVPPSKISSLPSEPATSSEASRGHARAVSLQPDMFSQAGHVHPKLPDYDDLASRLAAFRGS
ncbi:uncharacterized protein LOC131157940 [Malania oleifera]|uniref:uncharacterized protein LOC131157940 n=1 Tax=Malania oleifera TaxID=397392 RepID=UPI0025ADB3C5|nr:uncharacterized protein LOC131157940 [Malania oleifera]